MISEYTRGYWSAIVIITVASTPEVLMIKHHWQTLRFCVFFYTLFQSLFHHILNQFWIFQSSSTSPLSKNPLYQHYGLHHQPKQNPESKSKASFLYNYLIPQLLSHRTIYYSASSHLFLRHTVNFLFYSFFYTETLPSAWSSRCPWYQGLEKVEKNLRETWLKTFESKVYFSIQL